MSSPNLYQLLEQAQTLVHEIVEHPEYQKLLNKGYSPDLNIADAQTSCRLTKDCDRFH
ncbi:MAG: hypothetical protein RMY28_011800 [Nostoc sp. ChiSLP01]|nr:hypothetical protein [Nostoc sp. CmiSLP01]MDZ8285052.1 hypothetical protein [Nostoc sp. ChiSLP01]